LLPVRAMLGLHRFQVDETKEIDVDRNHEAVDIEVFYCGLSAPALFSRHQFSALLLAVSTQGR
jgi:hypothetical protein